MVSDWSKLKTGMALITLPPPCSCDYNALWAYNYIVLISIRQNSAMSRPWLCWCEAATCHVLVTAKCSRGRFARNAMGTAPCMTVWEAERDETATYYR